MTEERQLGATGAPQREGVDDLTRASGEVWCEIHQTKARASIVERRDEGGNVTWIQWCSLRGTEHCPEVCVDQLRDKLRSA